MLFLSCAYSHFILLLMKHYSKLQGTLLYAVVVFLRYGTFLAGQMGRQVGQEDTARDQRDADAARRVICAFGERRAAHGAAAEAPKGALPPAEKAGRTPAEPTPVPMQKGNTHGRALYACYAFLPLLKNAPMTSMTKNTIR